jgi:hypothetical protein
MEAFGRRPLSMEDFGLHDRFPWKNLGLVVIDGSFWACRWMEDFGLTRLKRKVLGDVRGHVWKNLGVALPGSPFHGMLRAGASMEEFGHAGWMETFGLCVGAMEGCGAHLLWWKMGCVIHGRIWAVKFSFVVEGFGACSALFALETFGPRFRSLISLIFSLLRRVDTGSRS